MIFGYKSDKLNNIQVFKLSGELIDKNQAKELLAEVEQLTAIGQNKILLDLHKLDYVNSSGLNVFINILTKARKGSGEVVICCVNSKIKELLVITKLDSIFKVSDSEQEALEILNK
jgi:anti-sigma B factor antagonist